MVYVAPEEQRRRDAWERLRPFAKWHDRPRPRADLAQRNHELAVWHGAGVTPAILARLFDLTLPRVWGLLRQERAKAATQPTR